MYATSSTLPVGYEVYTSEDLVNWSYGGVVMEEIWGMKKWYWAPDIMERNGRLYMLVSVNEPWYRSIHFTHGAIHSPA